MTLVNIEYGSLASSETLNKNFSYLEDKIEDSSESIMTSISSILSNIATINSRLNELSADCTDSLSSLSNKIDDHKSKFKILISKASMVPNWSAAALISLTPNYKSTSNGYILLNIESAEEIDIFVNGTKFVLKGQAGEASVPEMFSIPILKNDTVSCNATLKKAYFLPAAEVSIEDF